SGVNQSDFVFVPALPACAFGTVSPGGSCAIPLIFIPTGPGPRSATFAIFSNGTGSPQIVTLTGNGVQGTLTLTPNPLNFPDTVVGRQSTVQTVTVANNSNVPVTITGFEGIGGANPVDFALADLSNSCINVHTVPPGGSCPIAFTFNPT